jgi:hypothetical protein
LACLAKSSAAIHSISASAPAATNGGHVAGAVRVNVFDTSHAPTCLAASEKGWQPQVLLVLHVYRLH